MIKVLLLYCLVLLPTISVQAKELKQSKSQSILSDIRADISDTLSQVMKLESNNWTVSLTKSNADIIRVGVVIEPSTQTILSITAGSVGSSLGLQPSDRLQKVELNDEPFEGNFSMIALKHDDHLVVEVLRSKTTITLDTTVSEKFVPRWELYSSSTDAEIKDLQQQADFSQLQSDTAVKLLKGLQSRINMRLGDIYHLETKGSKNEVNFELNQKQMQQTRLGMVIDQTSKQVIRVEQGGNADQAGFQAGDVLSAILVNGKEIVEISQLKIKDGDRLQVEVDRDGATELIKFTIIANAVPAWALNVDSGLEYAEDACGVVNFLFNPQVTQDIYNAEASRLNDDTVLASKVIYELEPGTYTFKLYDRIPPDLVVSSFRRNRPYRESKELDVIIEPNKRYYIAAKFNRDKRWKTRNGEYWDPIIWKVEDYECSMD